MPSFKLPSGGIDTFYIDESASPGVFVMASVRVPLLRPDEIGGWDVVWRERQERADAWRRDLSKSFHLKFREELHAQKIVTGKVQLHKSGRILRRDEAVDVMRGALETLTFLEPASLIVAATREGETLFGHSKMQAALYMLLQRLQRQTALERTAAMAFFDEGHAEYGVLYRQAQAYLPAGSRFGGYTGAGSRNNPLSNFLEDGNPKSSSGSYFLQIADLVAYSALQKLRHERNELGDRRTALGHHLMYDAIPRDTINLRATNKRQDGIVTM